jgi:patatin-related protein
VWKTDAAVVNIPAATEGPEQRQASPIPLPRPAAGEGPPSGEGGQPAQPPNGDIGSADRQDVRFAVVMNGGSSLAVWISGVAIELCRIASARGGTGTAYTPLLDLLGADVCVDVISGTSAGGLNGAFLALGLARGRDLAPLRELWREHGSFDKLLRSPLTRDPKSLLSGDEYFLTKLRQALGELVEGGSAPPVGGQPIELMLTGTLWQGRASTFTDDMGTAITETDYDAIFRFADLRAPLVGGRGVCGDLAADTVLDELAAAARCTSSFPGAFEPHFVAVDASDPGDDLRWASTAGRSNFRDGQYVVDGGVLLNKPIRPALEAIYRQTAGPQVRRVLAYVSPIAEVAEQTTSNPGSPARPDLPLAGEVLLDVVTRLQTAQSVSRELGEIRSRNAEVRHRRRARDRFATAMIGVADQLSEQAWPGYLEVRADNVARTIAPLLAAGQRGRSAAGWSQQEMLDALGQVAPSLLPQGTLAEALARTDDAWDWGQTTVQRLADMTVDLLKTAVWLAPLGDPARAELVRCRESLAGTLQEIHADRDTLNGYWSALPTGLPEAAITPIPARRGGPGQSPDGQSVLVDWLQTAVRGWEAVRSPADVSRPTLQYRQALELAGQLGAVAPAIRAVGTAGNSVVDPGGEWATRLTALHDFLLDGAGAADVLTQMLRLDVVQLAFGSVSQEPEQEVELVQVSSRQPDRVTGRQLFHFGAFYRGSWRVNDWLVGRMDATAQLVRVMLSAERLRQRALAAAPQAPAAWLLDQVRQAAVPAGSADRDWLAEQWAADQPACEREVARAVADSDDAIPSLDACARAIARPIQHEALREDLRDLAEAVRSEGDDRARAGTAWLAAVDAALAAAGGGDVPAAQLWRLWDQAAIVGRELVSDEVGGDTFARTVAQTATVAASTIATVVRVRPVTAVLTAFRGYALAVWAMVALLTRPGGIAVRVVELAVAAGAVLVAVTLLVPAVPVGLTLAGVLLLLAGFSAAALLSPQTRRIGVRLSAAALVVLVALGGYLWWDWSRNGSAATIWGVLAKLGSVLLLVLLGWWVAQTRPRRR